MELRSLTLQAGQVSYREQPGEGPPIVFIHGAFVNSTLWDETVAHLGGRHCVQLELPLGSHPRPMNPDADLTYDGLARLVADALTALELDDVTLVANDTGGALTQGVMTQHPERIGSVVLTNCDAFENFPPKLFLPIFYAARSTALLSLFSRMTVVPALARTPLAYGLLSKRRLPDTLLESWTRPQRADAGIRRDLAKVARDLGKRHTLDAAARLGEFDRPVLLAWAHEDPFFKIGYAERLAAALPDARIERIADAKTFVMLDQPARLAELIEGFVSRPSPSGAPSPAAPVPR